MPIELFSAEPLKRYYATNGGQLGEAMQNLLARHASEKADQVLKELKTQSNHESCNATYSHAKYMNTRMMMASTTQKVVSFLQKTETDRLEVLLAKESQCQPTTATDWTNLVC